MKTLKVGADKRRGHAKAGRSEKELRTLHAALAAQTGGARGLANRRAPSEIAAAAREEFVKHAATRIRE